MKRGGTNPLLSSVVLRVYLPAIKGKHKVGSLRTRNGEQETMTDASDAGREKMSKSIDEQRFRRYRDFRVS